MECEAKGAQGAAAAKREAFSEARSDRFPSEAEGRCRREARHVQRCAELLLSRATRTGRGRQTAGLSSRQSEAQPMTARSGRPGKRAPASAGEGAEPRAGPASGRRPRERQRPFPGGRRQARSEASARRRRSEARASSEARSCFRGCFSGPRARGLRDRRGCEGSRARRAGPPHASRRAAPSTGTRARGPEFLSGAERAKKGRGRRSRQRAPTPWRGSVMR